MRHCAVQLACLILLLSTLGAAEDVVCAEGRTLGGHYVARLMQQADAARRPESRLANSLLSSATPEPQLKVLPVVDAMAVRPPAAQAMQVQAVTASGL